jgi:hypothetical protein
MKFPASKGIGLVLLLALLGAGAASALESVFAANKTVYRPKEDGPMTFLLRSPEFGKMGVWIYNGAGEIVDHPYSGEAAADQPVTVEWKGKSTDGMDLATGVYLIYMRTEFEARVLRLLLIR